MARQNYWESDFISGELSPRLHARVDLQKYATGVADLTNFIIQLQGGVSRRSGTVYVSPIKTQTLKSWLIPFTAQDANAYVIEMGNTYFRYYTQQGQLISGTPVETVTPYLTAELPFVDYAQSADTLFLVHPSHPPQFLKRTSSTSFALSAFNYQDGPYMTQNQDQNALLAPTGFTSYSYTDPVSGVVSTLYKGTGTITASGSTYTTTGPFVSTDVGRWVRILEGNFWGAAQITAFTDTKTVTATVFTPVSFGGTAAVATWRLGSWSTTTGWPSAVTFHQGRLCFANTVTEPQGFWASESGIFNLFSPTQFNVSVVDSNGLGYTISSNQLNSVEWMLSGQALMVGTYGSEYAVLTSSNATPLTPSNIAFQQQSTFGSKKVRPFLIGVSTLYVQRSGQKLREMTYDWSINGWRSTEVSMLSEHLFREGGGIIQACYQQEPNNIWWGCRADGTLIGMTYVKEQNILGFHKHVIGGTFSGGQAIVESVCCIPTPNGTQDQLWMIVKRTINGSTTRYVEYMDVPFDSTIAGKNTMNFVDAGIQSSGFPAPLGSPITHVTGLDHLKGQLVTICGDGSVQPSKTVANDGSIDLQSAASLLTIGLPYVSQLQTLPLPVQGDFGTGQGITKRIDRIVFRVLDTLTFKSGKDYNNLSPLPFATTTSPMDASPPLFTGDKPIYHPASYDTLGQFCIQADLPYPCNILGMSPQLVVQPK